MLQDSQGFMWFGGQDGLNRYDGYSSKVYRVDPDDPHSLRDDFVESLYEDRTGVLWVGTQDGWLEKYDRETERFTHYEIVPHIVELYEDQAGVFWGGTAQGLYQFDRDDEQATLITSEPGERYMPLSS